MKKLRYVVCAVLYDYTRKFDTVVIEFVIEFTNHLNHYLKFILSE